MFFVSRFTKFLHLPIWEKYNLLRYAWELFLTQTVYRLAFGSVGSGTVVQSPIMLNNTQFVHLGKNVIVRPGARFDLITNRFGVEFHPKVSIGDNSSFEQNFHLACAHEIVIEDKVAITENVGIFDIWHPYYDIACPIVDQPLRTAPVYIKTGSLIGMGTVIMPGVTIGRHCIVGANSVVTQDLPDFSVAVGAPARVIRYYSQELQKWVEVKQS